MSLVGGRRRAAGRAGGHGQAKVCHASVAQAVEEDVAGLDVPVDQARLRLLRNKAQFMARVVVEGVSKNPSIIGTEDAEDMYSKQCTERGGWHVSASCHARKVDAHYPAVGCFMSEQWP